MNNSERFEKQQIENLNIDPKEELKETNKSKCGRYYIDNIKKSEWINFLSLKIDKNKSYIVLNSNREILNKFMCLYILHFYGEILTFKSKFKDFTFDELGSIYNDQIPIIYHNKYYKFPGEWFNEKKLYELIASFLVDHKRNDGISMVLTEKPIKIVFTDSRDNFDLSEYLKDEIETIHLNDDLSLGKSESIKKVPHIDRIPHKDNNDKVINLELN